MFIYAIFLAIVIGYILKGRLRNFENIKINCLSMIFISFFIEFVIVMLIQRGIISRGPITYSLNLVMYAVLFIFIYKNRNNIYLLIMGAGFMLNAIPIFLNGGAMPVSSQAVQAAGLTMNIEKEGLYALINNQTRLWYLGDIIPFIAFRNYVVSIGDIISALGIMFFIISSMKQWKHGIKELFNNENLSV
jgi:hypothetical protein